MSEDTARIVIAANRGGATSEISAFLSDLESAYLSLYAFEQQLYSHRFLSHLGSESSLELGHTPSESIKAEYIPMGLDAVPVKASGSFLASDRSLEFDAIPPGERLTLERVRIESPGFWEFSASLNPLQQIREYLNDRHRRRQDREFREASERKRLELENELIQQEIERTDIEILRERIATLRGLGVDEGFIRRIAWVNFGHPLTRLGRHQDTDLIGDANLVGANRTG